MLRKIFFFALISLVILSSFIAWGLYLMEIEDHYGDLQEVYFESKSGDLILNKQTKNFGVISKHWKRSSVITKQKDTLDLYEFVNGNKYEVFKVQKDLNFYDLNFEKIIELKNKRLIEPIINN